jgi:thiamine transport system ATP-binding protein
MLELDELKFGYDPLKVSASCQVTEHGITAIMGPSGAGKSSLLACLSGFLPPVQGRILWQGQNITKVPVAQRPVSILFQDNNLFPHLTIERNLALAFTRGLRLSGKAKARISHALEQVGLSGFGNKRPSHLSGGQNSRAALARVLLQRRPILALDEPFSALGPAQKVEMLALVKSVCAAENMKCLMVTHDPQDARLIAEDILVVSEGYVSGPFSVTKALDPKTGPLRTYLA